MGGVELTVEANMGADDRVVDMRLELEVAGGRSMKMETGLTMMVGEPVVVPVGEEGGKKFGIVIEGRVIDGTGKVVEWRPGS